MRSTVTLADAAVAFADATVAAAAAAHNMAIHACTSY
jgi:hypothetical protein